MPDDPRKASAEPVTGTSGRRFRVALSFAGEKREFVQQVAGLLAGQFTEQSILYDRFHEAEFARANLSVYLPDLYNRDADLIVVVVCPNYSVKEWTGLEWRAIHDLIKQRRDGEVMLCRFALATVTGLFSGAGWVELDHKSPLDTARVILERLALNEGRPKDHYLNPAVLAKPYNVPIEGNHHEENRDVAGDVGRQGRAPERARPDFAWPFIVLLLGTPVVVALLAGSYAAVFVAGVMSCAAVVIAGWRGGWPTHGSLRILLWPVAGTVVASAVVASAPGVESVGPSPNAAVGSMTRREFLIAQLYERAACDLPDPDGCPLSNGTRIRRDAFRSLLELDAATRAASGTPITTDLTGVDLSRAELDRSTVADVELRNAVLRGAAFSRSTFARVHFAQTDFSEANLFAGEFAESCVLAEVNFKDARLDGSALIGVNASKSDFSKAGMEGADLYGAHLAYAKFVGTSLNNSRLSGVDLHGADLTQARLQFADLTGADLDGVDSLSGADLTHARVVGADLRTEHLSDAVLDFCEWNSKPLTPEQVANLPRYPFRLYHEGRDEAAPGPDTPPVLPSSEMLREASTRGLWPTLWPSGYKPPESCVDVSSTNEPQ